MHHLQLHCFPNVSAGRCVRVTGQCSAGDLAFSRVGHPQPSTAASRSTCRRNGVPQYETPFTTRRSMHPSHTAARAVQSLAVANTPSPRTRAAADFAIARVMLAK